MGSSTFEPTKYPVEFDVVRLTNQSTTSGRTLTVKAYSKKIYGVVRGYVAGTGGYDKEGNFAIENNNTVVFYSKLTQTSVTIECVVITSL